MAESTHMLISNDIQLDSTWLPYELRRKIEDELTMRNPKYTQALQQGRNTYHIAESIYLFQRKGLVYVLPRGYGKRLVELLRQYKVEFETTDNRLTLPAVDFGSSIKLRDYQAHAVRALVAGRQGGVVAPCGAGKTMILLEAMARIKQPTLWITHTVELAKQAIERATQVLDITEDEIGRIFGGESSIGSRLTVALVQSLNKADLDALKDKFGCILIDEAHHIAASTFYHPIGKFSAHYRLWASATPKRTDGLTDMVFAGGGPILHEIHQNAVPTITPKLEVIETDYSAVDDDYAWLMGDLIRNRKRNQLIVDTIKQHAPGHYSLVLSDRVEHLHLLQRAIKEALPDMTVELLVGTMKKKERDEVMQRVQNKEVDILLATQLAREGLDIKHLDRLFLAMPKKAAGAVQQEVGRVARPADGKQGAVVFDFWDSSSPMLKPQFWKRRDVYQAIGMDMRFNKKK